MSEDKKPPAPPQQAPEEDPPPFQPDPDLIAYLEESQRPNEPKGPSLHKEK